MTTPTTSKKIELINQTREILRGQWKNSDELEKLYKDLEEWDQFAYATDVLLAKIKQDQTEGKPECLADHQKLAKFIYKDHSLPSSFKFKRALQELNTHDNLDQTENCETLGLAGAIYKYKWLFNHQPEDLELSLAYYKRGFESWKKYLQHPFDERTQWETDKEKACDPLNDFGYTGLNYAYMLELEAVDKLESVGKMIDVSAWVDDQIRKANSVRKFILEEFIDTRTNDFRRPDHKTDVIATIAEIYFGLREFDPALRFIDLYKKAQTVPGADDKVLAWKTQTFRRQLSSLAYLQKIQREWLRKIKVDEKIRSRTMLSAKDIDETKITECLAALSPAGVTNQADTEIKKEGKVGLALSGGGFRASIFHIGVLAALAERDKLKDIEVISCVSGGSIIGTYYYLELKKQLEERKQIDYIEIIKSVEEKFLKGVQENLRVRVLSNFWSNMRMIFDKDYSRTNRLGELYEMYLFSQVDNRKGPFYMNDLIIKPHDNPENFNIASDNFNRKYKVPQLILNATTVNTGHNWQFTATWMGEPPGSIQSDIDVKPRMRRMYYDDAPKKYQQFRLGYAVGASSCVPLLFTPMPLYDLYPSDPDKEKIELQLIDGGLHDNQGIVSLLEQECKNMIISDASGQMSTTTAATGNEMAVFYRADTILQERLRELQFKDIKERANTAQINSLITVHLKSDLQEMPISWVNCTDPPRSIYNENFCKDPNELTDYGVLRSVQRLLSEIRTDLDSFNDTEALALMYSAYSQTHYELDREFQKLFDKKTIEEKKSKFIRGDWKFLKMKDYMKQPDKAETIENILFAARKVPFKLIDISKTLKIITYSLGILLALGLLILGIIYWNETLLLPLSVNVLTYAFIVVLVGFVSKSLASLLNLKTRLRKKAFLVILLSFAFVASNIYLLFFNPWYNKAGKVKDR
ncbi:MAG TPA: patatin-like phospholipase family protein [Ohtaekwangia sp.]